MIKVKYFYVLNVCNFSRSGTEIIYAIPGDILKFDENNNLFIYSVLGVSKGHINNEGFSYFLLSKLVNGGYIIETPVVPSILASIDVSTSNTDSVLVNPTPGTYPPQGFGYTNAIAIDPSNGKFYGPRSPEQWQLSTRKFFLVSDTPQDGMGGEARIALNENTKTFWYRNSPNLNQLMDYVQGNGVPDNNNGALDGTYYLDSDTMLVYGPKTNGAYINVSSAPARLFDSSVSTPNWFNGDLPSWPYAGVFFFDTFTGFLYNNTGGSFTTTTPTSILGSIVTSTLPMVPNVQLGPEFDTFGTYGDVLLDRVNMIMARPKSGASWSEMPFSTFITHNALSGRSDQDAHPISAISGLDILLPSFNPTTYNLVFPQNINTLTPMTGYGNICFGDAAGYGITTGGWNVSIGRYAGRQDVSFGNTPTVTNSVSIGVQANAKNNAISVGPVTSAGDNGIALGYQATASSGGFVVHGYGNLGGDTTLSAILYGHMDADHTKQTLKVNAILSAGKYTVAALPTGQEGYMAYASNGRKTGETAGNGTGVPVYFSNGLWRNFFDNLVVQA